MAQDILTEAIPARSYIEGSALNLARAALFGVPLSKVESIVQLLRTYRGGKPNSLILGGPLGWSWQATLDTTHHGSLSGPANAHRHSDLANIGIDDHHARDHAARHAVGGGDQVSLDASQIGSGTLGVTRGGTGLSTIADGGILYASAVDTLSRIAPSAANQVLRSTGANALQIAALVAGDIPNLDASKITTGLLALARGGTGADLSATGGANQVLKQTTAGGAVSVATLVAADIPNLDTSKIVSGTFGVIRGGTGLSSLATGGILYVSATNTLSRIAPSAANQVLKSTGANALQIAALVAADIPNLDTSKITTGRFGMARMPDGTSGYFLKAAGAGSDPAYANHDVDTGVHGVGSNYVCQAPASGHLVRAFTKGWTANKLLEGAGAGADPTEIDVPAAITYTELAGAETGVSVVGSWEDWDLSAIVPAGTKYVLIYVRNNYTGALSHGVRKNGSALNRRIYLGATCGATLLTECDVNRVVERYNAGTSTGHAYFSVWGYWS